MLFVAPLTIKRPFLFKADSPLNVNHIQSYVNRMLPIACPARPCYPQPMRNTDWYDLVRHYTERLVGIRSVSPGGGENRVAQEVLDLLRADDLGSAYTTSGLDPVIGDPYNRHNVYAFLR